MGDLRQPRSEAREGEIQAPEAENGQGEHAGRERGGERAPHDAAIEHLRIAPAQRAGVPKHGFPQRAPVRGCQPISQWRSRSVARSMITTVAMIRIRIAETSV